MTSIDTYRGRQAESEYMAAQVAQTMALARRQGASDQTIAVLATIVATCTRRAARWATTAQRTKVEERVAKRVRTVTTEPTDTADTLAAALTSASTAPATTITPPPPPTAPLIVTDSHPRPLVPPPAADPFGAPPVATAKVPRMRKPAALCKPRKPRTTPPSTTAPTDTLDETAVLAWAKAHLGIEAKNLKVLPDDERAALVALYTDATKAA